MRKGNFKMRVLTNEEKQQSLKRALTCTGGALDRWRARAATGLKEMDPYSWTAGVCQHS